MKTLLLALVVIGSHVASAAEYSVDRVIASSDAARAASEFLLDVNDVKDLPFTIQVASHLNEVKAIEHVKELKGHAAKAFYYPNFIKNQVYFKVCVGRFATKAEAEKFAAEFIKETSETFSSVISLLDRPGADKKATAAQVSSAQSPKYKVQERSVASISEKKINLAKEIQPTSKAPVATPVPAAVSWGAPTAATVPTPAPAATHTAIPTPASNDTEPEGKKTYSVQIASYPYEEMAKVATAKVEAPGKDIFYKPTTIEGKTWYRLYVGKFQTFTDATAFKKEIEHSYDSPIVRKLYE